MKYFILTLLSAHLGGSLMAQETKIVPVETFPINARVVSIMEGTDRGVLEIQRIDTPNTYGLEQWDEIFVKFYFGTKPVKNEAKLKGFTAGDFLSVRVGAQKNRLSGNWEYTAYHYVKVPRNRLEQRPGADSSAASQK